MYIKQNYKSECQFTCRPHLSRSNSRERLLAEPRTGITTNVLTNHCHPDFTKAPPNSRNFLTGSPISCNRDALLPGDDWRNKESHLTFQLFSCQSWDVHSALTPPFNGEVAQGILAKTRKCSRSKNSNTIPLLY